MLAAPLSPSVAPMEGITTFPMRFWLHLAAQPEAMTSPFLRATQVYPGGELPLHFVPELTVLRGVLPYSLVPQLLAAHADHFLRAADLLPPALTQVVELNCGCPSPNSAGRLAGSGLLAEPATYGAVLERLSRALGAGRLAVKMRLGIADDGEFADLLPHAVSLPLARLTIHGRTRSDGYRGQARWQPVEVAARLAAMPTWGSGDVLSLATLQKQHSEAPAAAGAMIGRGLLRNPWVFSEIRSGAPVVITAVALANALLCYLLLQELWLRAPEKLLSRVGHGRLNAPCGVGAEAWERLAAQLTALAGPLPFVLSARQAVPDLPVSPTATARLKLLWTYLRTSLPPAFAAAVLVRTRNPRDFFSHFLAIAMECGLDELPLMHQSGWDPLFSRAAATL